MSLNKNCLWEVIEFEKETESRGRFCEIKIDIPKRAEQFDSYEKNCFGRVLFPEINCIFLYLVSSIHYLLFFQEIENL